MAENRILEGIGFHNFSSAEEYVIAIKIAIALIGISVISAVAVVSQVYLGA